MTSSIPLVTLAPQQNGGRANKDDGPVAALTRALCFDRYRDDRKQDGGSPYMVYIEQCTPLRGTKEDFLRLFADTVEFFKGPNHEHDTKTIQAYIDSLCSDRHHYYFHETPAFTSVRETAVKDAVLLILGLWTLMRSYFVRLHGDVPHILAVSARRPLNQDQGQHHGSQSQGQGQDHDPLTRTLASLISCSGLLPNPREAGGPASDMAPQLPSEHGSDASPLFALHASADFAGSISIHPKDLNLFKLATLAGIRIQWTDNISRHLLLSQRGQRRYVELFALPSILSRGPQDVLSGAGLLSADLLDEIQHSYPNLFNPLPASSLHRWAGMLIALSLWCWCVGCSSRRLALRELRQLKRSTKFYGGCEIRLPYDAVLEELVGAEATAWDRTEFGNLWPRVLALDRCLQEAKPWNFWVLLRDNRDTVQYWTFLFGSIILILTIIQVVLGALQVAQAFTSSSSS